MRKNKCKDKITTKPTLKGNMKKFLIGKSKIFMYYYLNANIIHKRYIYNEIKRNTLFSTTKK